MAKSKTLDEIYPMVDQLSTTDQVKLKDFLEKTLQDKAKKAADELELINGKK